MWEFVLSVLLKTWLKVKMLVLSAIIIDVSSTESIRITLCILHTVDLCMISGIFNVSHIVLYILPSHIKGIGKSCVVLMQICGK